MATSLACLACLAWCAVGGAGGARGQEVSAIPGSTLTGISRGVPTLTARPQGSLDLAVESAVVFKNLEIFNLPDILGRTWFLYLAEPRLRYRASAGLVLEGGLLLGRNLGDDESLDIHRPVLRIIHRALPGVHAIAGTLVPTHAIHDAILDDVRKFATEVEEGFQLRVDRDHYRSDTWIDWRVREGAIRAEEFEIASAHAVSPANGWVGLRGQFMWAHAGGQVSLSGRVEQNLMYLAGASVGPGGDQPPRPGAPLRWRCGYDHLWSRDDADTRPLTTGDGGQWWARADLPARRDLVLRLGWSRYRGDGLKPGLGDPLYGLDRYDQLGANLLLFSGNSGLVIEAGFVKQWTDDHRNLTYQLTMAWNGAFSLGRPRPAAPGETGR